MARIRYTAIFVFLATGSCGGGAGPRSDVGLGYLEFYGTRSVLTAPTRVTAGEAFDIHFATFGGGCTTPSDVTVALGAAGAEVRPLDERPRGPAACPQILRMLDRTASLRFTRPGTTSITVVGLREPTGDTIRLTRRVTVVEPAAGEI